MVSREQELLNSSEFGNYSSKINVISHELNMSNYAKFL